MSPSVRPRQLKQFDIVRTLDNPRPLVVHHAPRSLLSSRGVEVGLLLPPGRVSCGTAALAVWEVRRDEVRLCAPLELIALAAEGYPVDEYVRSEVEG